MTPILAILIVAVSVASTMIGVGDRLERSR
jgi:hypothetical protein